MKFAIIGAGASGLIAAIKIKEKYPHDEVFLFDRMDAVGKKIKATGNGKCNIGNLDDSFEGFSNSQFVADVLKDYNQEEALFELGLPTKVMYGSGLYPISESASNVVAILEQRARLIGVNIIVSIQLLDYVVVDKKVKLSFDKYQTVVDKVIFANGGRSNPNLGSDGSLFSVFEKHGYRVNTLSPGLCPIRVQEDVKSLFGQRFHTTASLFIDGKFISEEYGEVMFKKDGLSGIVIMDLASLIVRKKTKKATIYLAVLDQHNKVITAKQVFEISKKNQSPLLSFVGNEIASYIYKNVNIVANHDLSYEECQQIAAFSVAIPFTYIDHYDFNFSQVTIGGIAIDNLNGDLSSKIEKNVFFAGEVVDVDGPCGGYNLKWAIGSALKIAKQI